jgi:hypothetical protein
MGKFIDLIGQKFGRLLVIGLSGKNRHGQYLWSCKCNCGNIKTIIGNSLLVGRTQSCGCLFKEIKNATKHGHSRVGKESITHRSWTNMLNRCNNPNYKRHQDYGGRGITVCDRWNIKMGGSFQNFLEDMGERPGKEYSIDRINNSEGYYKENCKWSTMKEQSNNRRKFKPRLKK